MSYDSQISTFKTEKTELLQVQSSLSSTLEIADLTSDFSTLSDHKSENYLENQFSDPSIELIIKFPEQDQILKYTVDPFRSDVRAVGTFIQKDMALTQSNKECFLKASLKEPDYLPYNRKIAEAISSDRTLFGYILTIKEDSVEGKA